MYLSRLILNLRSRQVQREIANPYEMHRTILRAFPTPLGEAERVLYRLELNSPAGGPLLLVQSQEMPDWTWLGTADHNYLLATHTPNPAVKEFSLDLEARQMLAFRLRANPTVKKKGAEDSRNGHRVGIHQEEEQIAWLQRKLAAGGARLLNTLVVKPEKIEETRIEAGQKQTLSFASVQFEGVLQVQDPALLIRMVQTGIGSAKGFGFGLLSLAPYRSSENGSPP